MQLAVEDRKIKNVNIPSVLKTLFNLKFKRYSAAAIAAKTVSSPSQLFTPKPLTLIWTKRSKRCRRRASAGTGIVRSYQTWVRRRGQLLCVRA
ncbi:hypothetical protein E1A91_D07G106600v1 [Gossypium mustelinum]|uniref:Uncharacterized protein n=1 Tax=Gossypium mustelinum TaxID=34275 RepID=A0A5D2U7Z1_GOSMU|nr:hypothetical protein E1A91_D07G106600v1 [Gossypium mustelinum]